jgi:VanZ family protein
LQKIFLKKIKPSILPGLGWLFISSVLLTLPGSSFPTENWLDKIWFDKWVHIGLFGILVFLFCWGLQKKYSGAKLNKIFSIIAVLALVYGIIMEFVQRYFIPYRSFDTGDIIADAIGCFAGWWLALKWVGSSAKK